MNFKYFEIHLVEHCNLKCQSCDNFSSLAEEEFIDPEWFRKQMNRMHEITGDQIYSIRMLGGEPLLHPQINELMKIAREAFPSSYLLITTNGILLNQMPEDFWKSCHDNGIIIEVTYYPINIDREGYKALGKKYEVNIIPFDGIERTEKDSHRNPVNDKKDQNIVTNYARCYQRWRCMSLKDGKLYPCTCIPNVYHFNKYFNKALEVVPEDYIDIFKTENVKQIEDFLDKPVPFCGYCNVSNRTNGKPWAVTKFKLEEWFDD